MRERPSEDDLTPVSAVGSTRAEVDDGFDKQATVSAGRVGDDGFELERGSVSCVGWVPERLCCSVEVGKLGCFRRGAFLEKRG